MRAFLLRSGFGAPYLSPHFGCYPLQLRILERRHYIIEYSSGQAVREISEKTVAPLRLGGVRVAIVIPKIQLLGHVFWQPYPESLVGVHNRLEGSLHAVYLEQSDDSPLVLNAARQPCCQESNLPVTCPMRMSRNAMTISGVVNSGSEAPLCEQLR